MCKDWPHAPIHRLNSSGVYMVTAGTYRKELLFSGVERLGLLERALLKLANEHDVQLEAWAVFPNHYHFIGRLCEGEERIVLKKVVQRLHGNTSHEVNRLDGKQGRKVWHNYWDTKLTYERSCLARLNYVHQNAVHHKLVAVANRYQWCSAAWFERTASPAQVTTIYGFKIDHLNVPDDF